MTQESSSVSATVESPIAGLRRVAAKLGRTSTWEDVFKRVMTERVSDAMHAARELEGQNRKESMSRRIAAWAFLIVSTGLMVGSLTTAALESRLFDIQVWAILTNVLRYLLYGGLCFTLVLYGGHWCFILKDPNRPRIDDLKSAYRFNSTGEGLRLLFVVAVSLVASWLFYRDVTIIYVAMLIALTLLLVSLAITIYPVRVLYIGALTQDALLLAYRLQAKYFPFRVVSILTTGLQADMASVVVDGPHGFQPIQELQEKFGRARKLRVTVVVDVRSQDACLAKLLEVLENTSLTGQSYTLVDDISSPVEPPYIRDTEALCGKYVSEKELLEMIITDSAKGPEGPDGRSGNVR